MKKEVNNYIKVSIIPKYRYNKKKRRRTWNYYVQKMYQTLTLEEFVNENKEVLVKGAQKLFNEIRKKNMKEYKNRISVP